MGQLDGSFEVARYKLKNKILGITCHNSKKFGSEMQSNIKRITSLMVHF